MFIYFEIFSWINLMELKMKFPILLEQIFYKIDFNYIAFINDF